MHFATRLDESHYELDRNDTHQLLLNRVPKDRGTGSTMTQSTLNRAAQLRDEAEASAAQGGPVGAVRLLEDSTAELVKSIRNAGIFISG